MFSKNRWMKWTIICCWILLVSTNLGSIRVEGANQGQNGHGYGKEKPMIEFILLRSSLDFHIGTPVRGTYREEADQYAQIAVRYNCPIRIEFAASELVYTGEKIGNGHFKGHKKNHLDDKIKLDAIYWVNEPGNPLTSFGPDQMYVTERQNGEEQTTSYFNIYGQIEIQSLTAQPAGDYEGVITITVSPSD